jgi:glycosyltransferase involved in cell wall biosynthesis
MKMAAHRLSSGHRFAGGVRRLSFVMDRVEQRRKELGHPLRIGIAGWGQEHLALPLADAGHSVTVVEPRESVRADATERATECGVTVSLIPEASLARLDVPFDFIIHDASESADAPPLAVLAPFLRAGGRAIVVGERTEDDPSFSVFRSRLLGSGWRTVDVISTVARQKLLAIRPSQQSGIDRALERLFLYASSFERSAAWIVEAVACDPTKPSVIHLMPSFGVGGAEQVVLGLASGALRQGYEVSVIGMLQDGALRSVFRERGIRTRLLSRRDPFGVSTVLDLVRIFRIERPDIVHTHLFGADAWGRLAAFLARVPVVVSTEHNINPSYGMVKRFVNRLFSRWTDTIVAVSDAVKRVSVEQDHIPSEKFRVIPNGIDLERLVMRGGHGFHDVPRLITVGRLYPQKDQATLLKALALVKRPWMLTVVGDGPLGGELRSLADRLGIASRIKWLGTRNDVPELLAGSDLFCFPSQWEGLGNAALEAAAAGVPVVLSDIPPLREAFEKSDATFVMPQDVPGWARAIEDALADPAPVVARALRAAPRIRANASLDQMVTSYLALYRSLLPPRV